MGSYYRYLIVFKKICYWLRVNHKLLVFTIKCSINFDINFNVYYILFFLLSSFVNNYKKKSFCIYIYIYILSL